LQLVDTVVFVFLGTGSLPPNIGNARGLVMTSKSDHHDVPDAVFISTLTKGQQSHRLWSYDLWWDRNMYIIIILLLLWV